MNTVTYPLAGMHCNACVKKIQAALAPLADSVSVSLLPPQAVLSNSQVGLTVLQAAVAEAGNYSLTAPDNTPLAATQPVVSASAGGVAVAVEPAASWFATYRPLLILLVYILAASVLVQLPSGQVSGMETMRLFMAGFFLAFSFFKLLDIQAFADAYAGYDLLAARWRTWGLIYPFVELGLGLAYLANWMPLAINGITLLVMGFSAIGVVRAVLNKTKIRCACLGAVFNLPMSTVTIIEDVGMALMAAAMIVYLA
ncbi:MAG: heavy-metal-associated domain-containing protein [Burkholderiales bacterium]